MNRHFWLVVLLGLTLGMRASADDAAPVPQRFVACANRSGAGMYWVDSTCGRVWWANPGLMTWQFVGEPEGAQPSPIGTFVPYENRSGPGVYVLNTATGEGWWTDGRIWKHLGPADAPAMQPPAVESDPPPGAAR